MEATVKEERESDQRVVRTSRERSVAVRCEELLPLHEPHSSVGRHHPDGGPAILVDVSSTIGRCPRGANYKSTASTRTVYVHWGGRTVTAVSY